MRGCAKMISHGRLWMPLIGSTRLWGPAYWSRFAKRLLPTNVVRQQAVAAVYQKVEIHTAFHADLIVEDNVIVEIKAIETIAPVHKKAASDLSKVGRQT